MTEKLKAWVVECLDGWCTLMHAETRGKAIHQARIRVDASYDFTYFRARRLPDLDGRAFEWGRCALAGFEYLDPMSGEPALESEFVNDCRCEVCRPLVN